LTTATATGGSCVLLRTAVSVGTGASVNEILLIVV
jgi:hypothetical protein